MEGAEVKLFGKWSFEDVEVRFEGRSPTAWHWRTRRIRGRICRVDFHARTRKPLLTHPKLFLAQVNDMSLEDYVAVKPKYAVVVPHTAGRYQTKRFRKAQCPIVER